MRFLKVLVVPTVLFLLSTAESPSPASTATPTPTPPPASPTPSPSPSPAPSPTPNGSVFLDVSAGGPNTSISVSGSGFFHNQQMTIYWDTQSKVIGSAQADGNGNFGNVKVKPFAGDAPGLHHICASVPPNPCAQFELQGSPSPTPTPPPASPSPVESPSPSAGETPTPTPSILPLPAGNNTNNLQVLLQPPFVFLPFIAMLGLLGAIAYWAFGAAAARRRLQPLPSASVVHYSARPQAGLPGIEYAPPPAATPTAAAAAQDQPFTPEELDVPWPSLEQPPSSEPEPPSPESPRD